MMQFTNYFGSFGVIFILIPSEGYTGYVAIEWDESVSNVSGYYIHYGTTLRGLQIHYGIQPKEYLNFVHDLPLHQYLQPNPALREMLRSIPKKRWIFTNSDQPHVERVLSILGIYIVEKLFSNQFLIIKAKILNKHLLKNLQKYVLPYKRNT